MSDTTVLNRYSTTGIQKNMFNLYNYSQNDGDIKNYFQSQKTHFLKIKIIEKTGSII